MDSNFLTCSLCTFDYDQNERVPRMLNCGHTFCTLCLKQILVSQNSLKCPLDKSWCTSNLDQIPINFIVKQMAEQKSKAMGEFCEVHKEEEKNYICLAERQRVCKYCSVSSHTGHDVQHMDILKARAEHKANLMEEFGKEFERYPEIINQLLLEDKEEVERRVKTVFQSIKAAVEKQEQKVLRDVNSFVELKKQEKMKDKVLKAHSNLKKCMEKKKAVLKGKQMNEEFFKALLETEQESPLKEEYESLKRDLEDFRRNVTEQLEEYEKTLAGKICEEAGDILVRRKEDNKKVELEISSAKTPNKKMLIKESSRVKEIIPSIQPQLMKTPKINRVNFSINFYDLPKYGKSNMLKICKTLEKQKLRSVISGANDIDCSHRRESIEGSRVKYRDCNQDNLSSYADSIDNSSNVKKKIVKAALNQESFESIIQMA